MEEAEIQRELAGTVDVRQIGVRREELQHGAGRLHLPREGHVQREDREGGDGAGERGARERCPGGSGSRRARDDDGERRDDDRRLGARPDEERSPEAHLPLAPRSKERGRLLRGADGDRGADEQVHEERELHAGEEAPRHDAAGEEEGRDGVREGGWGAAKQPTQCAYRAPEREHGDQRREVAEKDPAEPDGPSHREHRRIERCRLSRGVSLPGDPLEGMAPRGRAREVEMDVDVIERGRKVASRRAKPRDPVERGRGEDEHDGVRRIGAARHSAACTARASV